MGASKNISDLQAVNNNIAILLVIRDIYQNVMIRICSSVIVNSDKLINNSIKVC